MSEQPRRYSEKESQKILQRAADLQTQSIDGAKSGVGLDELKKAAASVGFDPELVARAAAELDSGTQSSSRVEIERLLPGELTEDRWLLMVMELRKEFGKPGETNRLGPAYEWTLSDDGGTLHFSAMQTARGVQIRLTSEYGPLLTYAWVLGSVAAFVVSMLAGKFATKAAGLGVGFLAFALVVSAVAFVTWYVLSRLVRKHTAHCQQIMSRFSQAETPAVMAATPVIAQEDGYVEQTT